ncbi:carbohydrate esterase family 4 protein [Apiospora saccharicola]
MVRLPAVFRLPPKLRRRARRRRMTTLIALVVLLLVLVVPFYVIYKPPRLLIRYFSHRWPDVLWEVPITNPKAGETKIYDAHATFFTIGGQVSGREETLADVVRGGHELGNHAMHDEPSRALSDAELTAQIETVRDKIRAAYREAGRDEMPPQYFRPGSGFFSDRMRRLVDKMGYRIVLGSIYPHDPQIQYPAVNARHILSMLRPGAIIICHDRRPWTPPMLRTVLKEMKARGYQAVTVSELLRRTGHS